MTESLRRFVFTSICAVTIVASTTADAPAWQTATPEEVGLDSAALVRMFDAVRARNIPVHSVQIVRDGRLALDAYFYPFRPDMRHDVASVTKSVTSTLVGLAIDQGHISGVQQNVASLFPGRAMANLDARKKRLTVEHLLTMQAGWDCGFEPNEARLMEMRHSSDWIQFMLDLPMVEAPGERWAYCSGNCHVLSTALTRATKMNAFAFAKTRLFEPLGIKDVAWPADGSGHSHGWGDLQMRPLDMAKLGQLFLQLGRWGDRQIIAKEWIAAATKPHVQRTSNKDHYGYFWWVKGADFPTMYEAVGRGGQRINVWPAKELVIVFTGGGFEPGDLAQFILDALKSDKPLPANPEASAKLQERFRAAAMPSQSVSQPKALTAMAGRVSGKVFTVSSNALGLERITLHLNEPAEAKAELILLGRTLSFPVGLDGVERFAPNSITTLPQAAKGQWTAGDEFTLELNLVGGINFYTFTMKFANAGNTAKIAVRERTGLVNEEFDGAVLP